MNFCLKVLDAEGFPIDKNAVIVDFGCGSGSNVKQLREKGFNVIGCDFPDGGHHNEETDRLLEEGNVRLINKNPYRLPFDDNSVDYIYSITVMEHVFNFEETVAEQARILKPGGACFHFFPSKYALLESHLHIPFGGVIQNYPYVYFWALMGLRKYYQKGKPPGEVARQNYKFLKTGMNYFNEKQLKEFFEKKFSKVWFAEKSYFKVTDSKKSQMLGKLPVPGIPKIYRNFWANALVAQK